MNNTQQRLKELLQKQLDATATEAEQKELFAMSSELQNEPLIRDLFEEVWQDLDNTKPVAAPVVPLFKRNWFRLTAAAAAILVVSTVIWRWPGKPAGPGQAARSELATTMDIGPGKEGAILILDDGRQIILDTMKNGSKLQVNGVSVQLQNGRLVYDAEKGTPDIPSWHTMSTPKGRQFQLKLPDGSQAWLNAASSIRYPSMFTGEERKVEITGEVYLEVIRDARKPFRVITAQQEVEVMGTGFNINAYTDETNEHTTLLEGSIQVQNRQSGKKLVLKPGEQGVISGAALQLARVDTDPVMAWKNGLFHFENDNIPSVMRQLQRWYNIEVSYEGNLPEKDFNGKIQRDLNLSEILNLLEQAGVHFKTSGERKLVVIP